MSSRYFLTMYGYQTFPNFLRTAHTFAEVTKKTYHADGTSEGESTLISWLPSGGTIHLFGSEPGRNYSLDETFAWAASIGAEVRSTTAEILPELYDSFLERRLELDSGAVLYIMNDRISGRPSIETNCIHAISDLPIALASLPMLDTGLLHGYLSIAAVFDYLQPWFIDPQPADTDPPTHPELGRLEELSED